jgi:hypothetical protein
MDDNCVACPNSDEGVKCYDLASCRPRQRRHKMKPGKCVTCDGEKTDFHPPHDPSPRCESGGRNHCSCDTCF